MIQVTPAKLFGRLNSLAYKSMEGATTFCKLRGNQQVETVHWLHQLLKGQDSDVHRIVRHFELDAAVLVNKTGLHPAAETDIEAVCEKARVKIVGRIPFDERVPAALARGETPLAVEAVANGLEAAWKEIEHLLDPEPVV